MVTATQAPVVIKRTIKTHTFEELRQLTFPPENHIIGNGLLSKNSVMALFAPPKSYKSFTLNTLIVQLLTGGHLFNVNRSHARTTEYLFPIIPVERVLLLEQEIGLQDTQERWMELYQTLSVPEKAKLDASLFIRSCDYDLRFDSMNGIHKIRSVVEEVKPDILCIDPLTKFHTSEENSPSEMGKIILALRQMIHDFNMTVILIHHTGKNEEGKEGLDLLRGASSIAADIDTGMSLHVTNRNASIIWVDIVLRRGKPINSFKLRLDHQSLRTEFHGWAKERDTYQREAAVSAIQEVTGRKQ